MTGHRSRPGRARKVFSGYAFSGTYSMPLVASYEIEKQLTVVPETGVEAHEAEGVIVVVPGDEEGSPNVVQHLDHLSFATSRTSR